MDTCEEIRACLEGYRLVEESSGIDPRFLPDKMVEGATTGIILGAGSGLAASFMSSGGVTAPVKVTIGAAIGFVSGVIAGGVRDLFELIEVPLQGPPLYRTDEPLHNTGHTDYIPSIRLPDVTNNGLTELEAFEEFRESIIAQFTDDPEIMAQLFDSVLDNSYTTQFYSEEELNSLSSIFGGLPDVESQMTYTREVLDYVLFQGNNIESFSEITVRPIGPASETVITGVNPDNTGQIAPQSPIIYATLEDLQGLRGQVIDVSTTVNSLSERIGSLEGRIGSLESNSSERVSREPQSSDELAGFA